jgi:hypothetical protein
LIESEEINQMIGNRIEERRKEISPDLFNQVYVEQIIREVEILESVIAEISNMEKREERINKNKEQKQQIIRKMQR